METLPFNAATMTATIQALGTLVFVTVRRLPPAEQIAFAQELAKMAGVAERAGNTTLETILIDLQRAAREAP